MKFTTAFLAASIAALATAKPVPFGDHDIAARSPDGSPCGDADTLGKIEAKDNGRYLMGPIYKCKAGDTKWYTGPNQRKGTVFSKDTLAEAAIESCEWWHDFRHPETPWLDSYDLCTSSVKWEAGKTNGLFGANAYDS